MSGAFHRFNGLSNNNSKPTHNRAARFDVSEPCIYKEHRTNAHGWRCTSTGACADCIDHQSNINGPSLSVDRIRSDSRTRALRFWSKVDITTLDDCWKYEGSANKKKLLFMWRRPRLKNTYSYHSIRVATWLTWGDYGNSAIRSLCGERRCCNPLHNVPDQVSDKDIQDIDLDALQEQLEGLQQNVRDYLLTKSEKALQKELACSEHYDSAIKYLPSRLLKHEGFVDEDVIFPYHSAVQDTLLQLKNGSHPSQFS